MEDREAPGRPRREVLADHRDELAFALMGGRCRGRRVRRPIGRDVDDQQVVRPSEVMPESRRARGHRRLARIRPGQQVCGRLAAQPFLDLERGPDLGELECGARDRDVHERAVDRAEVLLGGQQQVAGNIAADPDGDRERLGIGRGLDELLPVVTAVRRGAGDHTVDVVLDDDAAAEMGGQDLGDAGRAAVEQDLLGEALLHRERSAELPVGLAQDPPEVDLVLVASRVVDRDRRVTGERRQQVGVIGPEAVAALRGVEVQRADGLAAEDQWRTDDRSEVVLVQNPGPVWIRRVVVDPQRALGQDRLRRDALAEVELEPVHLDRPSGHRDHPQCVPVALPQEHVAAVGIEQAPGIIDDRGKDGLEVERFGHPPGGRQESLDLFAPPPIVGGDGRLGDVDDGVLERLAGDAVQPGLVDGRTDRGRCRT
jgi:hypothetical protein